MSWRKKVKLESDNIKKGFANWFSQLCAMLLPRFLYIIAGRGSSKTTDILVERVIEMMYDMPGAPAVWVADTYSNLQKNVLRTVLDGLEAKGYKEGVHYVIGKAPPEFTEAEKRDIDPALREHFWKPYNKLGTYKHTLIFFTGFNITFGSLDRPASLAGNSYVHVFGDEVKYFKEEKIANLLKAIRGFRMKYGNSVFYRGHTFTTDMPDTSLIGQYDWILKQGSKMNKKAIMLVLKAAMILNDALGEYLLAKEEKNTEKAIAKKRVYERWKERWIASRLAKEARTFFFIVSSYVNVDILTPEWFDDAFATDMSDTKTAILSMKGNLESGERFYANIGDRHFYEDGNDPHWSERFGILDEEDSRILRYLNRDRALEGGADFGNMISLTIAQEDMKNNLYRCHKFIYTLSPEWIRELADKFLAYFCHHNHKVLKLYYDRAANSYKKAGQDLATQLKKAIELKADGKTRTGWRVVLMSEGQGNIYQSEEYNFMQELFSGHNKKLPRIAIDRYNCKQVKCSLELAKTKKTSKGQIEKDKRSEKLPIHKLPLESTNPSDSFKYLMMRREWKRLVQGVKTSSTGTVSVRI